MKKKIIVVISDLGHGGAEHHISQVFPRLSKDKYQIVCHLTSAKAEGILAKRFRDSNIKIYSFAVPQRLAAFGRIGRLVANCLRGFNFMILTISFRPDFIHCYLPGPYLVAGMALKMLPSWLLRKPLLLMSRRSMNYYQKKHPKLAAYEKKLHQRAAKILANSQKVFDQLLQEGVELKKLALIYNGIDCSIYQKKTSSAEFRRKLNIPSGALVLSIVANLFPYKGHIDLLQALVIADLPVEWVLLCAGLDRGCLSSLMNFAEQQGLVNRICWLGKREDVPEILANADIGILCSHEEGFSNSILEGMAASLPMIVTDVGGNAEAIVHNETGIVVPAKNPSALAAAITRLSNDPQLRDQMGAKAYHRVQRLFSLESCLAAYDKMYQELG